MITTSACAVSSCSWCGLGEDQNTPISSPYNNSFLLCHRSLSMHSLTSSIIKLLTPSTPFPNSNATLTSLHYLLYFSTRYSPAPAFLFTSSINCQFLSNFPHIINKCSTSSRAPLSHTPHFFSSDNPVEPVLSLNSRLTPSWHCTDVTYFYTPVPFFANLSLQCTLAALPPPSPSYFSS